ncbi:ATP-binding protein [Sporomusa carbonis]|uniref:ATP-binding protein n=1 Tax=Sporomusa carbonis TaxID=3076075 RepID=UPI003C7CCB4F
MTFLLTFFLVSLYAKRLNNAISLLVEYSQRVAAEGYKVPPVKFSRLVPNEFSFLARHFFLMAKQLKDHQQALLELNSELEQRVAERTKSLSRNNQELAILNRLITPITPSLGIAGVIEGCLSQFLEVANVKVQLHLANPTISSLGSYEDVHSRDGVADIVQTDHSYYLLPIRAGNTTVGHLVVANSTLSEADQQFLQTLSHSVGIILQNELLLRSIQQKHAVLKAVLESMCDAIILIDNRQEVVYANCRMARMLDFPCEKLRGSSEDFLFEIVSQMLLDSSPEVLKQIRQENGLYKLKIKQKNNQERFKLLSAFPVTDDEGNIIGKGYLWRDITKEHEVDKLKNDLISLVSHEFKTPITSIKGSVETLLRQDAEWDENFKREMLIGIHEDIGRIQELVNDWLDFSKIDSRAISLNREPIRPCVVVDNAIRQLPKHFGNGTIIDNNVCQDMPLIYADRMRLEQVLSNLLTNAIRYNDRTPHITISADSDERYVNIRVADNGIGINDKHLDKVFDRFYCIDAGWVRRTGGTGLGLAICKGIMEAHGGTIRAESTEGVGSVFTVSIPKYKYTGDKHEKA